MLDAKKLAAVDAAAAKYQPPMRNVSAADYAMPGEVDTPDNHRNAPRPSPDGVVLINGSTLTPQAVRWLWEYWLALGKLHILAGAPGQGKTTIALAAMATVTIGGRWPDGTRCAPGNVLMWTGEDDLEPIRK